MRNLWNFIYWERFKLQRRWMPWIILALLLFFSQMVIFSNYNVYQSTKDDLSQSSMGFGYLGQSYDINCQEVIEGKVFNLPPDAPAGILQTVKQFYQDCEQEYEQKQEQIEQQRAVFTLPGSIPPALGMAQSMGIILFAILTASVFGTESGWGTIRLVLAVGTRRWHYLFGKLALLALAALGSLVLVVLFTIVSSLIVAKLTGSVEFGFLNSGFLGDVLADVGRSWFAMWPYIALAALFTVLSRSSAAGIALAIGYYFIEAIVVAQLLAFDWFQTVADYLLGRNVTAWMTGMSGYGQGLFINTSGELPGQLHAALVLVVYILVLSGLALWLFQRRDITATSTG
jgi:ABC-type transport system involved in multi-copper enzyme maturation permease subunit